MVYYNTPSNNETMDLYGMFKFIGGEPTGGLFWFVILSVIWVVSFMATKQYSSSRAFLFSSFFCSILAIFMAVLDLLAPSWMYLMIFLTLIGFIWLKLEAE